MSKYTIKDVANIVPDNLTTAQRKAVEDYLNKGTIPAPDPCQNCDPNFIRKLIGLIETAKRAGLFPPKRESPEEARVIHVNDNPTDPDVDFTEIFSQDVVWSEETLAEAEGQD